MTETAIAWDTYSRQRPERRPVNARGETTWFNWTQYEDHGPGAELLALPPGGRVLDLGCGKGGNAAHLASLGMQAVAVDVSPAQLRAAGERWGAMPGLKLHQAEAVAFLQDCGEPFDAVYSVYGAVWFTDPARLLPVVRERLCPGGTLVFSQRPPVEGCYGCQASYIPRGVDEDPPRAEAVGLRACGVGAAARQARLHERAHAGSARATRTTQGRHAHRPGVPVTAATQTPARPGTHALRGGGYRRPSIPCIP
ncbi:class I SAM-dependent methyltransferase [Streptomyces sp. NPDC101152]|uniref:class I SAM-dependent methyltransferase n=1 Tax=Streptomyces sp. NPDC101152 TaxID=3366116 RepID=UPI003811BC01